MKKSLQENESILRIHTFPCRATLGGLVVISQSRTLQHYRTPDHRYQPLGTFVYYL